MVISERKEGITQLRIRPWDGKNEHYIEFGEESYTTGTGINPDFETDLRNAQALGNGAGEGCCISFDFRNRADFYAGRTGTR